MELQDAWQALEKRSVAVFALSYDSVEVLAAFAEKRGITYPLLSDEGSHTIRAAGLLNEEHLVEQHAFYGIQTRDEQRGVAYPGTFVLDEAGVVTAKYFEQSYRVRPTARIFEEFATGVARPDPSPDVAQASRQGLEVRAWTDAPTYRPYQQVRLHVEMRLAPETHVFASPVPDGYTALSFEVDPLDGLTIGTPELPTPQPFSIAGLQDRFMVYEDTVRTTIPLLFTSNLGSTGITLRVHAQICTPLVCFPPNATRVDVTLNGLDLIRD
ncbi:MAG: redoxin domain-containing protein [Chloroflexi bacterium]|nr:redoxin domain-containing protein [Chloroflexota bacterium]